MDGCQGVEFNVCVVLSDGWVHGQLEPESGSELETLVGPHLILGIDGVLNVVERRKGLLMRLVISKSEGESRRFGMVHKVIPSVIDIITGPCLHKSVDRLIELELDTACDGVDASDIADLIGADE